MAAAGPRPSAVRRLWLRWKSLRLPWRKRFLVGTDLTGNTFWEFRDGNLSAGRFRRIVQYNYDVQHSDVNVAPQWVQWLRQTRRDPPSMEEQQQDLVRQTNIKVLASQADARWAAKPSYLVAPAQQAPQSQAGLQQIAEKMLPPTGSSNTRISPRTVVRQEEPSQKDTNASTQDKLGPQGAESPWKAAPKKDEPEAWSPKTSKRL